MSVDEQVIEQSSPQPFPQDSAHPELQCSVQSNEQEAPKRDDSDEKSFVPKPLENKFNITIPLSIYNINICQNNSRNHFENIFLIFY